MEGEMVVANMFHEIDREFMESINVLVVDDDIICLTIVAASLRKCRYSVVTVKHADDALYALRLEDRDFDLVISDVHMPDMNGFELLQVITDEFDLPVVLMSADDKESMMLKGLECGAVFFILKPISPEDLKDMWQYCILRKRNKLRKGKSVVVEEINDSLVKSSSPGHQKIPRDIVLSSSSIKKKGNNGDSKKEKSKKKSSRKHKKAAEKEDNITPSKKPKIVWTASLHNKFLEAIKELGYDGAFPRKILEIMKVPGLTRENVASHLQKYRIFLQKVSDAGCEMQEGDTNLANSAIQLALQSKGRSNFSIFPQGSTGLQQYLLRKGISNTNSLAGTSKRGSSSSSKQKAIPLITTPGYGQPKLIPHKGESSKSTSGNANQTRSFVLEDVATQLLNAATSVDYQLTTGNLNSLHNSSGADKETDQGSDFVSVTDLFGEERHEYFEQSLARSESSLIGFTDKEFAAMLPGHVNQGASMQLQPLPNNFGSILGGSGAIVDQDFGEKRHESDPRGFSSTGFTDKEFAATLIGHIDQEASVQLPPLPIAYGDEEFAAMRSGHINQGASVQLPPLPIEFGDNEFAVMLSGHINQGDFMQLPQLPINVASFEGGSGTILDQNVDISMIDTTNSARNSSGIGDLTSTFVSQLNVQPSDVENKDDQDGTTNYNFSDGNNQDQEAYFPWFDQTQVEQGDQTGFAAEEGSSQLHNNLPNPLEHGYDEDFWDSLLSSGPNFGDQK